jgi:type IV pilus assembly protein PilF
MQRWLGQPAVTSLLLLWLTACASSSDSGIDRQKASEINAELGLRYMLLGNLNVAYEKLERALEYNSRSVNAHHYLAELYHRLERPKDAEHHFRQALRYQQRRDDSLHNNYGSFLCRQNRVTEGSRQLLIAAENTLYPQRAAAYENLGLCHERTPDMAQAEGYYRQALALNPQMPLSLAALARITFEQGNFLSSRAYQQRYLEVARADASLLWLAIRTERQLGNLQAATDYSQQLATEFPESDEAKLLLQSESK